MYSKSHIISSSANLTNYQIKFTVYYGDGNDSEESVYLNSKCRTDFGDIRFFDAFGNKIPYWIESYTSGVSAVIWVKLPSITTNTVILIYYGQPNAVSESSGNDTFIFFDDFESGTISSSKWQSGYSSYSVTTESPYQGTYSAYKTGSSATLQSIELGTLSLHVLEGAFKFQETNKNHYLLDATKILLIAGSNGKWAYYTGTSFVNIDVAYLQNTWYKVKLVLNKSINTYYIYVNDSLIYTVTNNTLFNSGAPTKIEIANSSGGLTGGIYFDIIRVRAYAITEPTHGAWNSEIQVSSLRIGGIFVPSLVDKCVLHFTGQRCSALFGDFDEFPIIPSDVTVTNNGTWTKTDLGNNKSVLNFDGATNVISLSDDVAWDLYSADFTVCGWIQFNAISTEHPIYCQFVDATHYATVYFHGSNHKMCLLGVTPDAYFDYEGTFSTRVTGQWYHFAVIRSGSSCLMYEDGVSKSVLENNAWTGTMSLAAPLTIGQDYVYFHNGQMKDLLIYKGRALTVPEIKLIMNRTHPITGPGIIPGPYDYYKVIS